MEKYINQRLVAEDATYVVSSIDEDNQGFNLRKLASSGSDYFIAFEDVEILDEKMSLSTRRKKAISARKNKAKMKLGRKKAAMKMPSKEKLQARAEKRAKEQLAKKITKGKSKSDLSPAEKDRIEDKLKKMKPRVKTLAKKLLPQVRKDALQKRSGSSK